MLASCIGKDPCFFPYSLVFLRDQKIRSKKRISVFQGWVFVVSISNAFVCKCAKFILFKAIRTEVFWYVQWTWASSSNWTVFNLHLILESPSLEILKIHLDMVLGNRLEVASLEQGAWIRWHPENPSSLNQPLILWTCQDVVAWCLEFQRVRLATSYNILIAKVLHLFLLKRKFPGKMASSAILLFTRRRFCFKTAIYVLFLPVQILEL